MKKTFAVVLAAMMLVVALAGCGTKTEKTETSPAATEETTTSEAPKTSEAPVTSEAPATSEAPVAAPSASAAANG